MKTKLLTFQNAQHLNLHARLALPENQQPISYALFAHCFTCGKDLSAIRYLSQALTQQGFGVFSFDFAGLGSSDGEFSETSFHTNIDDLKSAATFLSENFSAPQLLIGHSLGGAAVLAAASEIPSIKAVTTIAAPADPAHVTHLFDSALEEIAMTGKADVLLANRPFTIGKPLVDSLTEGTQADKIHRLKAAKLILHSPSDKIVDINSAAIIFDLAVHPKSFITLDGADHLLTNKQDALYTGDLIASWAKRYIDIDQQQKPVVDNTQNKGVSGRLRSVDKYSTTIQARQHTLIADEPANMGGDDLGMTPYELLSAGLSACTAITLRMYADRKGIALEEASISINHQKVKNSQQANGFDDVFTRQLTLKGSLSNEEKQRLLEIADKCPVHRTLHQSSKVVTTLLE